MLELRDRFRQIIRANTSETRRWKELEDLSGIPAANWLAAVRNKQRPTAEMIEALARAWPQYAYWLVTGATDARYGHVSCATGRPGGFRPEHVGKSPPSSATYLRHTLDMFLTIYGAEGFFETRAEEYDAYTRLAELDLERLSQIEAMLPIEKAELQESIGSRRRGRVRESQLEHARSDDATDNRSVTRQTKSAEVQSDIETQQESKLKRKRKNVDHKE